MPQIQDICTSIEPDVKVVVRENTVRAQKEAKKAKENSEDNREFWELGVGIVLFIAGKHWNLPSLYTVWYVLSLHI